MSMMFFLTFQSIQILTLYLFFIVSLFVMNKALEQILIFPNGNQRECVNKGKKPSLLYFISMYLFTCCSNCPHWFMCRALTRLFPVPLGQREGHALNLQNPLRINYF